MAECLKGLHRDAQLVAHFVLQEISSTFLTVIVIPFLFSLSHYQCLCFILLVSGHQGHWCWGTFMSLTTSHTENITSQSNQKHVILLPKGNPITPNHENNNNKSPLYLLVMRLPTGDIVQLGCSDPQQATQQPVSSTTGISISSKTNETNDASSNEETNSGLKINYSLSSSSLSQSSPSDISMSSTALNAMKLTTKLVRKTVNDVLCDSSQSLTSEDSHSRNSSQSDAPSLETVINSVPRAKPGRKSKATPEEDPSQKKIRSLERNRAAAMRCREKSEEKM